jgi:hypothetical protein
MNLCIFASFCTLKNKFTMRTLVGTTRGASRLVQIGFDWFRLTLIACRGLACLSPNQKKASLRVGAMLFI